MSIELILLCTFAAVTVFLLLMFLYIEFNNKELDAKLVKEANNKIKKTSELDPNLSLIESHKIMTNTIKTSFKNKLSFFPIKF